LQNPTEIRCIEHTIHLGAAAFVKAVGPKMKNWTKNHTASVEDADEEDDDEEWVADWNKLDVTPDEEAIDEEINFEPGDTLGKALALINQVSLALCKPRLGSFSHYFKIRASSQAKAFFVKCCTQEGIPELEVIKWIRTRWGSMYDLTERLIDCRDVFALSKVLYFLYSQDFFRLSRHFVQRLIDISPN
jgi:hypothetical protein